MCGFLLYLFVINDEVANFFVQLHDIVDFTLTAKCIATKQGIGSHELFE